MQYLITFPHPTMDKHVYLSDKSKAPKSIDYDTTIAPVYSTASTLGHTRKFNRMEVAKRMLYTLTNEYPSIEFRIVGFIAKK